MWDMFVQALSWLMLVFFGGQAIVFVGLVLRVVWTDTIKPRLTPVEDINRAADDLIASYPNPELEAFDRHERAWYASDVSGQVYWNRVLKAVRKRLGDC